MENKPDIFLTDFETGIVSLSKNSDLNNILNFTYNFDLLKNVLSTIIKNQNNLKKEYDEKFQAQSEEIELLKQELEKINEENGPKGRLRVSKNDFNELKGKVNDFEDKLAQINEALDQSKLNIIKNNVK